MKRKVAVIVGTRPEAIKLIPVYLAFQQSAAFEPVLVSTGQHREMLQQIFNIFETQPDHDLEVMTHNQSLSGLTARLLTSLSEYFDETKPDLVVVQGDTTTCMAAALAAFYRGTKVAHVEAGLRTGNKHSPFPEEMNRRVTDYIADLRFAPTEASAAALAREDLTDNVFVVGNTVIDSLLMVHSKVEGRREIYCDRFSHLFSEGQRVVLVTGHRRESFGRGFQEICTALERLAHAHPDVAFIYPVHLNPNVKTVVHERLGGVPNVRLIGPVPYDDLVYLLGRAWIVMTDSGGIQEEAPALKKPVVVMRDNTERPEGVESGCAVLGGTSADSLVACFEKIARDPAVFARMSTGNNPYGDGRSSAEIVRRCEKNFPIG
jgi:UDP-N-acetylglucosamine 2-epimerase (non-hydrolysing)